MVDPTASSPVYLSSQLCATDDDCGLYYGSSCLAYDCDGSTVMACTNPDQAGLDICSPVKGQVDCGGSACFLDQGGTAYQCCSGSSGATCELASTTCETMAITCEQNSDCASGDICCMNVTDVSGDGTMSCQTGTTCPTGAQILTYQVCESDTDCGTNTCEVYSCASKVNTDTLFACKGTIAGAFTGAGGYTCTDDGDIGG
jgi:hypothetical protein